MSGPARMVVNGVDLSTYDLWVETPDGWGHAPSRRDVTLDSRGAGAYVASDATRIGPREWSVEGVLDCNSAALALAQWDAIKGVLFDAWLEVLFLPWTDRMSVCRVQTAEMRPQGTLDFPGFRVALTFLAPTPYLVAPQLDSYGLIAGGEVILALGSAPSPFLLRLVGPSTQATVRYYDAGGRIQGSLVLAGDLNAGEWLEFDSQTLRMERHTETGVTVNGAPYFSTASTLFPLDPADGTPDRGPSVVLDDGSGVLYTRKCYR